MNDAGVNKKQNQSIFLGVAACFVLSGFAALLYQTAWMRQLSTVFGTSELAVATVLAAYMAGLAFGAAIAARFVDAIRKPVLVYGVLEAAIAVSAIAVPYLLSLAGSLYAAIFGGQPEPPDASGGGQSLYYLVASFVVLAIPTACMGATLPLLTRYAVQSDEQVGPRTGALYALNTAGAVGGTLVAAFILLPSLGLMGSIIIGALTNLIVFGIAVWLSRAAGDIVLPKVADRKSHAKLGSDPESLILPVMFVSGMATFTYEVLWTRLLSHILGGSLIAFAIMLASFLSGIAIGSAVASRFATSREFAVRAFVVAQLAIAVTSMAIYLGLDAIVPEVAGLSGNVPLAISMLLPSTIFIGATFPFAVRILSRDESDAANASARVYSWNTVGAIGGATIAGFLLIPLLRYEGAVKLAVIVNLLLALAVAIGIPRRDKRLVAAAALAGILVLIGFRPVFPETVLRVSPLNDLRSGEIRFYDVGRSATVLMLERDGFFFLRTNGLPEASTDMKGAPPSRHSQRLLAALPVIARPDIEKMLVVGLGGGVVAEDIPAAIKEFDVVELEPKVVEANRLIASERNSDPFSDPRVSVVVNDARNAMRLTDKTYDAIVSQPSHPWTAGASHLYTREFMTLVDDRLTDDGVFLQWMNLGFVTEDLLRSLAATMLDVFPYVRAYQVDPKVVYFIASRSPIAPELGIARSGEPLQSDRVSFSRKGMASLEDVVAMLAWNTEGLRAIADQQPIITDDDNLMAMGSAKAFQDDALSYSRIKELLLEHGPLYNTGSVIHRELGNSIDFVYVGDRLSEMYAPELVQALVDTLEARGHPHALALTAKELRRQNQKQRADVALLAALERDSDDVPSSFLILQDRGESVASGALPERLSGIGSHLPDSANAVILNWGESFRGRGAGARQSDAILGASKPNDQWYIRAAKMRADWRIRAVQRDEPRSLASDAMSIIDDAIALHPDLDMYGMRMAASFLAEDYNATVETARRMIWVMRLNLESRAMLNEQTMSSRAATNAIHRLDSIVAGLEEVRNQGLVEAYKLDDLTAQAAALRGQLGELVAVN
jgi:spermidine synthase